MKKIVLSFAIALIVLPAFAFADSAIPIEPTLTQLFTRVAAIEAQEAALTATSSLACAALTEVPTIPVGQAFILAWGSVGAMSPGASSTQSMWTPEGAASVTQKTPGNWKYDFTFYGLQGGSVTCSATIKVTS
ncbi:MAG TPA: hypothetical protein VMU27_02645 [Candidatus Paceibacterota bacterium]|nr:hypothetical protein [Candidatus Paceibacterota bacterium]